MVGAGCCVGGGITKALSSIAHEIRQHPLSFAESAIPAVVYTVGANMQMVGFLHLGSAVAAVLFQTKILLTGLFARVILGRQLTAKQWLSLTLLMCGVLLVIMHEKDAKCAPRPRARSRPRRAPS